MAAANGGVVKRAHYNLEMSKCLRTVNFSILEWRGEGDGGGLSIQVELGILVDHLR